MTTPPTAMAANASRRPSGAYRIGRPAVWVALAVGLPGFLVALSTLSTVDLAYGIRAGQLVLGGGGFPQADTFTFTAGGLPWVDQQWLAHVIFGAVYGFGGWTALQVLWVGVAAATVGLIARAAFVNGAGLRTAVLLALAGFTIAAEGIGLRAQVLGLLCLAALLVLVAGRRDQPILLWLAVPLIAVWANLHGSFVVGLALLAATTVDDRRNASARQGDLAVLASAAAATLVNPYRIDAWRYVVSIGTDPTISALVTEWRHTDPLQPVGAVFYASIVGAALLIVLAARRAKRPDVGSLLWLGLLAALGAWALRAVAWWGLGAVPMIAVPASQLSGTATGHLDLIAVPSEVGPGRRRGSGAAVVAMTLAVVLALALPAGGRLDDAPPGIADALRSIAAVHPGVRVFDAERWGSWLELQIPEASYFADSRIELIPASAWGDYVSVSEARSGWQVILDRWQVGALAISSGDQPSLVAAIDSSAAWRVVHRDADGLVAVRSS